MKKLLTTVFTVLGCLFFSFQAKAKIDTVQVADFSFTPANLTICFGDTIRFVWMNGFHNVHITAPFDSTSNDLQASGNVFEFVPPAPATYSYVCDYHSMMAATFTVMDTLVVNLGPDTLQCGGSVTLNAGNPGASYLWSTGETTQSIVINSSDTVYVDVSNACETVSDTVMVYIFPTPSANAGSDATICPGNSVTIGGSPSASGGTLPYTYAWSPAAGLSSTTDANPVASPTATTSYVLVLQDSNGCAIVRDTVIVKVETPIMVDLGPDDTACTSVMLDAGNPGNNYWWYPGNGSTQTIVADSSGWYYAIVWNTCFSDTDSVLVYITGSPSATTSATAATCGMFDGTATATPTGGIAPFTYIWGTSPVQTTQTATGLFTGTYSVMISDAMGCLDTAAATVGSTSTILQSTFAAGNNHRGNMFDITAISTVMIESFDSHPMANTSYEIYYKSGTYVGSENNAAAWTLVGSAANVVAQPQGTPTPLPIPVNVIIPAGQTYGFYVTSSNITVSQRYTNGTAVGNVFAQDASIQFKEGCGIEYPFASTPFTPRVWNGRIHYCTGLVGTENVLSTVINVYPNPSSGTFTVSGLPVNAKIKVMNLFGEKVLERVATSSEETIQLKNAAGIYIYTITDEAGNSGTGKIVIE